MQWNSISEFLAMGTAGPYVWGSFGLTAVVLVIEVILLRQRRQATLKRLRRLQQLEGTE